MSSRLERQITRALRRSFSQRADSYKVEASTGEKLTVSIRDRNIDPDTVTAARAETPCYSQVVALSADIADPYAIEWFREVESGRKHKALRYQPSAGNNATHSWYCETQRLSQVKPPDPPSEGPP